MTRHLLFAATTAALGIASVAGSARSQDSDAEWLARCRHKDLNESARYCEVREVRSPATSALSVDGGENGGAVVAGGREGGIRVRARIQANAPSAARAAAIGHQVRVRSESGRLWAEGPGGSLWSVVFYVDAPVETDLTLRAHNGPLSVKGIRGTLDLRTENGPVALDDVGGDVRVRAENGPVTVRLKGSQWEGKGMDAQTVNGPMQIEVPEGYSAEMEVGTVNGPSITRFPVTVTVGPGRMGRMHLTLGSGGALIRAVTTNGPFLLKRPGR